MFVKPKCKNLFSYESWNHLLLLMLQLQQYFHDHSLPFVTSLW